MRIRTTKIFFLWWWWIRINLISANQLRLTNRLKNLNRSKPSTVPGGSTMMEPKNSFLNPLEIEITYIIIYAEKYSLKSVHSIYKETGVWSSSFRPSTCLPLKQIKKTFLVLKSQRFLRRNDVFRRIFKKGSVKYHTIEFLVFGKILATGSEIFTFKPSKSYDSVTINLSKKSTFYLTSPGVNCTAFDSEQIWKRVWVAQKSLPSHAFKCFGLRTVEFSHSYSEFFRSLTIET